MAATGNKRVMMMFLATVVLAAVSGISSAKSVVVGGSTGWTIPTSPSFYSSWSSQQTLQVGDVLVFTFPAGIHTVAEVSKANYDSCTPANTVGPVMTTAPANITLTKPGTHYFICTITGHCGANQKLAVTAAASTPAATAPIRTPSHKKAPTPVASPAKSPVISPAKSPVISPATAPVASPITAPVPSPSASTPAPTPSSAPVPSATGTVSPAGSPTVPTEASGPAGSAGGATPPTVNSAVSTGVSILSLVSIVAAALVF